MPLDPLQERIARTALGLPVARTLALAGGGAMIVHGFVDRETRDIDLFTEVDDREAVNVAAALRSALEEQGLTIRDALRPPRDHRFVVADPAEGRECSVEVFADGGRLHARVFLGVGPVLHPEDLAADKVLALWGRARPRDFLDVAALLGHYPAERLLELARAKDSGFGAVTFLDALRSIARLGPDDWAEDGISAETATRLRSVFDQWRDTLKELDQEDGRST
jgi:hypothetical protein